MNAIVVQPLPAWVDVYLTELARHGMEQTAAAAAKTTVRAVRALAENNSEFAYAIDAALETSADAIEAEVRRRAIDGIAKGIYYQGDLVATETQYSDTLLQTLIKAKRRREFGDKAEITGPNGGALVVNIRTFGPQPPAEEALTVSYRQLDSEPPAPLDEACDLV